MATIDVLDADGIEQTIERPLAPGRAAAAASRPVALSTEDKAVLDTILAAVDTLEALIAATNSGITTLSGGQSAILAAVDTVETLIAATNALLTTQAGYLDGVETKLDTLHADRTCSTGTISTVAASASDVTILAANANRKGATVLNDSSALLYLLVGTGTASATARTVELVAGAYYEVPFGYTGVIKGIWASAVGNGARVMEYT